MKQYCRYCCNACLNDDELAYCSYKDEMLEGPGGFRAANSVLICETASFTK